MASRTRIVICLLRNDLRFHDNEVLHWANKNSTHVLPLYCFDPRHFGGTYHFNFPKTGCHRLKLLLQTVTDLRQTLREKGSDLIVRHGKPEVVIKELIQRIGSENVSTITYHNEVTDEELKVENAIKEKCGVNVVTFWGHTLYHKDDLPFSPKHSLAYLVRRARTLKKHRKISDTWTNDGLIFIKYTDGNIVQVKKEYEMAEIEALCGLKLTYPLEPLVLPDVYTQFRKRVEGQSPVRKCIVMPDKLNPLPDDVEAGDIPTVQQLGSQDVPVDDRGVLEFKGGETVALERLQHYLFGSDSVATYKETRNGLIGADYSTKFSMWLAFGCLSPRHIYWEIKRYESERVSNQSTYWVIFELIWRDYFRFVALKYGNQIFQLEGIQGKHIQWKQDKELFNAWKDGRTGVPFVDANMRELAATGFMSNRGRQNVASFLTKDLKLDWRLGAEWFESQLIDHDVCSNYGNWLYSAGIGNDPREDRKFNMIKQGLDYDPEGDYIRLWLPELAGVKGGAVHTVWTMGNGALSTAGVSLGETYPKPVVIAPEWSRHFGKKTGSARGGGGRGGGSQPKQNRGIDFYFKGQGSSKKY